mmetsp:Transcript_36712/g.67452  ORF Transcript_36712/g.67452 Transcript_36712/m.67452 type:complete len:116 (-) Transcript_36712:4-351(-)
MNDAIQMQCPEQDSAVNFLTVLDHDIRRRRIVAATAFCRRGAESRSEGKKRRRLEDEVGDNYLWSGVHAYAAVSMHWERMVMTIRSVSLFSSLAPWKAIASSSSCGVFSHPRFSK